MLHFFLQLSYDFHHSCGELCPRNLATIGHRGQSTWEGSISKVIEVPEGLPHRLAIFIGVHGPPGIERKRCHAG